MHRTSRLAHAPTLLAKRIARYLAGSAGLKLLMKCDGKPVFRFEWTVLPMLTARETKRIETLFAAALFALTECWWVGIARSKHPWRYRLLRRNTLLRLLAGKSYSDLNN